MSIRLVFIIFLIVVFAAGTGFVSYSQSTGITLKQAYDTGNVVITQNTSAGTVPHQVNLVNSGNDPVKVKVGDILVANSSQDLVVAENRTVEKNSTVSVMAYCIEPSERAVSGTKFTVGNPAPDAVKEIIYGSNPKDIANATGAQVQIWILASGNNLNIYSGEPVAMVENQNLTYTQLRQMVADGKTIISTRYNVGVEEIKNLNLNETSNSSGVINGFLSWLKTTTGI